MSNPMNRLPIPSPLRNTTPKTHRHRRLGKSSAALMIALLAVIAGFTIFGAGSAHAQGEERDYVDVGLVLEVVEESIAGLQLKIIVVNHGSRTAYDVDVEVDIAYPEDSSFFHSVPDVPIGSASLGSGGYSLHWTIPALGKLQRAEVVANVNDSHHDSMNVLVFDKTEYVHEYVGEVTTTSFESNVHQGNNRDRVWSVAVNPGDNVTSPRGQPIQSMCRWTNRTLRRATPSISPSPQIMVADLP